MFLEHRVEARPEEVLHGDFLPGLRVKEFKISLRHLECSSFFHDFVCPGNGWLCKNGDRRRNHFE